MSSDLPFHKVFPTIASRHEMFTLLNRGAELPIEQRVSGATFAGEWFELTQACYLDMLDILPPLFQRSGMFAMSEFKSENVASVFFEIAIRGRRRWFHAYCDLCDPQSPERMRAAIIAFETQSFDSMTRAEKLEFIWTMTHGDFKGIAGAANPAAWPLQHRGKRTILVNGGGLGTILKLLEDLTEAEIAEKLSVFVKDRRS